MALLANLKVRKFPYSRYQRNGQWIPIWGGMQSVSLLAHSQRWSLRERPWPRGLLEDTF